MTECYIFSRHARLCLDSTHSSVHICPTSDAGLTALESGLTSIPTEQWCLLLAIELISSQLAGGLALCVVQLTGLLGAQVINMHVQEAPTSAQEVRTVIN